MAAVLRFAARRICGCALERPPAQVFLTAAKELAGPTRTLPSRHGRTALRRPFSSSTQSPSPAPNLHSSNSNKAEPMTSLSARALEKTQELHDLLRQMNPQQALHFAKEVENKRLLQQDMLVGKLRPTPTASSSACEIIVNNPFKIVTGTLAAAGALMYLETKFIVFPLLAWVEGQPSS